MSAISFGREEGESKRKGDVFRTRFENEQKRSFRRCHVEQGSVATAVETSLGQTVFFRSFDKLRMTGIACFWFFACLTAFS